MKSGNMPRAWHDKSTHHPFLKTTRGKFLHYYFYFIDEAFGLCYLRLPTWAPFRLQIYFNGHAWLARKLFKAGITFDLHDNAFISVSNPGRAQQLADALDAKQLHRRQDRCAQTWFPFASRFRNPCYWSFMRVEYATDVVFRRHSEFQPLYENIVRSVVQNIKADQVATFLGRKLTANYHDEYDKFGLIARVECTTNDVSFFKHRREVEQRNGETVLMNAPL